MNYAAPALKQLKENSGWYLILGIGLIIGGMLALYYSYVTTIVSVIYLGAALFVFGVFEALKSFKVNQWSSFFLHIFLAILFIVGGVFIIANPALNALTITLFLAIFFVVAGIARILFALTQDVPHKGWVLVNGILTLLLGFLIWKQWPYSGLWVLGMFMGIDMIFTGITWIQLSMFAKKIK